MRLVFGPDDHEEYAAARERLRLLVVAWARRRGTDLIPALVAAVLDHKHAVDGRIGHWTAALVEEVLAVRLPRTTALPRDDWAGVPAALDAVVGFLAAHQWLDSRSDAPAVLRSGIEATTPALYAALADERHHDVGTFWAVQMLRHGVEPGDPGAVSRFLAQVASGEIAVDRAALAVIEEREARARTSARAPDLAPVLLPGAAQLLEAAHASEGLDRLRTFTRWVRAGRRLTRDGRLQPADARAAAEELDLDRFYRNSARGAADLPETTLVVHWAVHARLVRVVRGRLLPVKSAAPVLSRPIELWRRAFDALGALGDHLGGTDVFGAPSLFGMSLSEAFPLLTLHLYLAGGQPMPVELFHRAVREAVDERFGCPVDDLAGDVEHRMWRRDVAALLDALELLGAVRLTESADHSETHDELVELAGRDDPDPTLVTLTPIGLWAVHETLREQGISAPVVGALAGEDIEFVCARTAAHPETARAELIAWVRARDPETAADELARFVERTDVPEHRALALDALARVGSPEARPRTA
ncbi:hypothetical protein [Pseudonocardia sp.]|uniref:hypothetical protein n=1 Tax=Pseudonocardia sp. TaxID=60912 RepID=UPI003D0B551D